MRRKAVRAKFHCILIQLQISKGLQILFRAQLAPRRGVQTQKCFTIKTSSKTRNKLAWTLNHKNV